MATGNLTTDPAFDYPPFVPTLPARKLSEDEFVAWCDQLEEGLKAEWIDGDVVMMSPVNRVHARVSFWIGRLLAEYVETHQLGEVYGGEVTIRFGKRRRRRIPDLFFVSAARLDLMKETYFDGPPDIVLEVVSPDSHQRDWQDKHLEYESVGVGEYWVIDPIQKQTEVYSLQADGKFRKLAAVDGWIASKVVPGFRVFTDWLCNEPRPTIREAIALVQGDE